jgi:thiol peroxidase
MVKITFKGSPIHTSGKIPARLSIAPDFRLVDKDLKDRNLSEFSGKKKVIATVPSLDTGVCSMMTKQLNDLAKKHSEAVFITISADLPFAQNRFCSAEGVSNVIMLSTMRNHDFGREYGLLIIDGPLEGVLARSVMVLDEKDKLIYGELVSEITKEPNFTALANCFTQW